MQNRIKEYTKQQAEYVEQNKRIYKITEQNMQNRIKEYTEQQDRIYRTE